MNKVITINLGGNAYQLEEGGYDALRDYLESGAARLKDNPDRDEILSDIEIAIADKFRALLGSHKTVVVTKEVVDVLAEMGPIEADGETAGAAGATPAGDPGKAGSSEKERPFEPWPGPKRLYRITEGEMIAGVCNGIAAYFNMDPTFVRLGFVLLTIFWGTGIFVYLVMAIIIPEAKTPEEKAAASGSPVTAQEIVRRAKEGYYEAAKHFPSGAARREWARKFRRNVHSWAGPWRYGWRWQGSGAGPAPNVHPAVGFALPIFSLLIGVATILWICALISLLSSGNVLGMELPDNIPVWLAVILLFIAYGTVTGSLKAARHSCYWGRRPRSGWWSIVFLLEAAIGIAFFVCMICLAIHFFPELREAVQAVPGVLHQAAHDIHEWWNGK